MTTIRRPLIVCALCTLSTTSFAWIDTGHMVVAAIAWTDLKPSVRKKIELLLKIDAAPKSADFIQASAWADDTKNKNTASWHYINWHFRLDGKPVADHQADAENIVWAINSFTKVLADPISDNLSKSKALKYLIHFVGDIHQPLHCVALDSAENPEGDRGGNLVKMKMIMGVVRISNLHFLWDIGAGVFLPIDRPLSHSGLSTIRVVAKQARRLFPRASFPDLKTTDALSWSREGLKLAKDKVYAFPQGKPQSSQYLAYVQDTSLRQVTLAGYRLADLLNRVLK